MKRRFFAPVAALMLIASPGVGTAEVIEYKIDNNHSLIGFNIRHFFTKVPGRFKDYTGTITFDDQDMSKSSVDVTIQTASVDTENERRDNHLRTGDFFLVDSFPAMTFTSTKVVPGPNNGALVYGDLTIRGITKPVTLDAKYLGSMTDSRMGRKIAGFEAFATINRKDFNILWNRILDQGSVMLADEVEIVLQIEANWRDPNAPPPPGRGERPAQAQGQPEKK